MELQIDEAAKFEKQMKDLEKLMNFRISDLDKFLEENKEILNLLKDEEDD